MATLKTALEDPVNVRSTFPVPRSQSFSVLSPLAESAVRPSRAMPTLCTGPRWPVKVRRSCAPEMSQSFNIPFTLPTAVLPSGAMATLSTAPE